MKWEALPLADRAKLMAAAVRNGYTDIRSIKEAYVNYLNLKLSAGNRYAKGGDTDEPEVVNLLDKLPVWKALEKIDYTAIPDPEFTREKTGAGSIEYFSAEEPEGITYNNGYHRDHPMPGHDVILYDPNTNDEQDIRLDALHIMPKDPTYDALNSLYREAAKEGDVAWAAKKRYEEDLKKYGANNIDSREQYFNNEADGLLRNMFIEGTPEYIKSKRYHSKKEELRQWNAHLMPYINRIEQYLRTGERPADILPELIVTDKKAYGGNLFQTGGNKKSKKKSLLLKLQERRDYYRQQLIIRGLRGAQLDAVLANMEVESGFNPDNVNPYSGAKGLMQWLGSRKPKSWSEKDQLDYIAATYNKFGGNEWLDKAAWKRFNETTDPAEAARLFRRYWERPEKSSWYATDALFKNSNSYLPKETNDLIKQVASLEYNGPKEPRRPVFTEADLRLLDSPILASHNVDYDNYESPDYQESPLMQSIKLNPAYDEPDNPLALYSMLASLQSESALNDPYNWMSALMTVSPKTTPEQKQAANWLFNMTGDGGQLYHGLNFAAYGGNLFDNGGQRITDEEMKNLGWHWGKANPDDPLAASIGNRTDEEFILDENNNLVPKNVVENYINSISLPEVVVTADKHNFDLKNYLLNKLRDRIFESAFPDFVDILNEPLQSITDPFGYSDSQTRNLQTLLLANILNSSYDPNFAAYALTNPYVMKNSIFFNSNNPLVRRFDVGGSTSTANVDQELTVQRSEVDPQGLADPMYEYDPKYYEDYGIGNHPDFDEDFRNRYGLRYAPYDEVDFGDTSPDDIRLNNQENVTVHSFQGLNPNGTLLVGPDNKLINQQRLAELSQQYRTDNNEALRRKYYHLKGEKPLEQKNPEFYLLAGGAHAMLGLANEGLAAAVVDPMMNMQLTDGFIDDTTPYTGWGDMMSNVVGGPEWAWDLAHPAIAKDMAKGVANVVKNAVSPSEARAGVVGDFIDHSNMPEPSANWNGDWAALEEYRATHGGRERLQAAYDELSKAASTNANAKAKIDALRQKHDAEQLALILQHIAKNGVSAMYTRTPGLSELAAKLEQELAALYEELGYNKAYSNAPEYAANHYLVPTTEEIHNIPVTSEGDAAYSVIEPSVDEATGEVTFVNRSVNNPYDGTRGNMTFTHEVNHLYVPYADGQLEWLDMSKLDPQLAEYLKNRGGPEIADRGSLIKNYFGLREGEEVTPEMLQYAAEHYVDDVTARGGIDNDMSAFFSAITDYDAAAKWINKWALGITPAAIGTTAAATMAQNQEPTNEGYALGGPLIRTANNLFNDGGFYNLPEQRAYERAVNLKAPFTNYEDAVDMDDSIMLRLKKFFDKGVSNCTLTASQLLNPNRPIGRARTIVTDSLNNGFYEVDSEHIVPGTMVIASHPNMSDYSPEQNYHTMVVTGFAPKDYEYTFRDGTKYQIKKGEPLVSYSRGKASADNYVHDIPLSVYNDKSEGKTYNRYYRPIDENYPQVMLPEITFTK